MRKALGLLLAMLMIASVTAVHAEETKADKKRAEIDKVTKEALDDLFGKSDKAKGLYDKAFGYAVFDNMRVTFIVSGGGGAGVAVEKASGKRTYMKMGTGGLSLGIGAQKYQVIMFFEDQETFNNFITKGWKAESGANAAAGTAGANVGTNFINGIAVYQITEAGLMASADISGTKYSIDKKLNK